MREMSEHFEQDVSDSGVLGAVNRLLDTLPRAEIRIGKKLFPTYFLWGGGGVGAGFVAIVTLAALRGLSPLIAAAMTGVLVGGFVMAALFQRWVLRTERHVLLMHFLTGIGLATASLRFAGAPLLPWLDVLVVGYGFVFCFGRIGCSMSGCCHGLPSNFGIRYDGQRRFPVQLVEAGLWAVLTLSALAVNLAAEPGRGFALVCVCYGALRIVFERLRGDQRPRLLGMTESDLLAAILVAIGVGTLAPVGLSGAELILVGVGFGTGLLVLLSRALWLHLPEWSEEPFRADVAAAARAVRAGALGSKPTTYRCGTFNIAMSRIGGGSEAERLLVSLPRGAACDVGQASALVRVLAEEIGVRPGAFEYHEHNDLRAWLLPWPSVTTSEPEASEGASV